MATRRKSSKDTRGGSSNRPRNDGRITEQQHEDAMRVLRAEYYQSVRSMAEELGRQIKEGEITDRDSFEDAIHQDVDGSHWVIHTHANFQVLMCSDHHDAYSEDFGEPPISGDTINWAALAFAALSRDLRDQLQAEAIGVSLEESRAREAPRGRHPMTHAPRRPPPPAGGGRILGRRGR